MKVDEASLYIILYKSINEASCYRGCYNPCNIILIISKSKHIESQGLNKQTSQHKLKSITLFIIHKFTSFSIFPRDIDAITAPNGLAIKMTPTISSDIPFLLA